MNTKPSKPEFNALGIEPLPPDSPIMNIDNFKPAIVYTIYIASTRRKSGRR